MALDSLKGLVIVWIIICFAVLEGTISNEMRNFKDAEVAYARTIKKMDDELTQDEAELIAKYKIKNTGK